MGIKETAAGAFPGWAKAGSGDWEPRVSDIIDARWIPTLGSYCFSHRVFYMDRESGVPMLLEEYDNENKLWKSSWNKLLPLTIDNQKVMFVDAYALATAQDWENGHETIGSMYDPTFNKDVPGEYSDAEGLTQPGSLARIMK